MGRSGEYTTGAWFTLRGRPGLSTRDQGKRGPSGESNAPPIESLPLGCAGGCFDGVSRKYAVVCAFPGRSALQVSTVRLLQSIFGRGVKVNPSPLQSLCQKGKSMFPLPSWIDPEAWAEYEAMRVRIKKPLTLRSFTMKVRALQAFRDAGHDVTAIIDQATDHHWLDFYAVKEIEVPKVAKAAIQQTAQYLESERTRAVVPPPAAVRQLFRRQA